MTTQEEILALVAQYAAERHAPRVFDPADPSVPVSGRSPVPTPDRPAAQPPGPSSVPISGPLSGRPRPPPSRRDDPDPAGAGREPGRDD